MSVGVRSDPYLGFRFLVEVDSLVVAGFSEVGGLEAELETESYEEGGNNTFVRTLPKRFTYPKLVLKRGLTDSRSLWEWVEDALHGRIDRKQVTILLLDTTGTASWGWTVTDAYPVKWTGPELQADQTNVAVEALELAHHGVRVIEGLPPG